MNVVLETLRANEVDLNMPTFYSVGPVPIIHSNEILIKILLS